MWELDARSSQDQSDVCQIQGVGNTSLDHPLGSLIMSKAQDSLRKSRSSVKLCVLLPRTRGFTACVKEFRHSHIKCIYAYRHLSKNAPFNEAPDLICIHTTDSLAPNYQFPAHAKRYAISDLPDDQGIANWLRQRYVEKDQFLAKLCEGWIDRLDVNVREETW